MENIPEEKRNSTRTIGDVLKEYKYRINNLEGIESKKEVKGFKLPFKWNFKFAQARSKAKKNELPCFIFTKDGYLDGPIYLPIRYGNLITWNDQAYKFRPEALWKFRTIKKVPFVYCIKEIDMEPISNLDINEIRERGDATEHHQFLLKQFLRASTSPLQGFKINWIVIGILVLVLAGGIIWLIRG